MQQNTSNNSPLVKGEEVELTELGRSQLLAARPRCNQAPKKTGVVRKSECEGFVWVHRHGEHPERKAHKYAAKFWQRIEQVIDFQI